MGRHRTSDDVKEAKLPNNIFYLFLRFIFHKDDFFSQYVQSIGRRGVQSQRGEFGNFPEGGIGFWVPEGGTDKFCQRGEGGGNKNKQKLFLHTFHRKSQKKLFSCKYILYNLQKSKFGEKSEKNTRGVRAKTGLMP